MFLFLSPRLLEKEKDKLTSLCVSVGLSFFFFLSLGRQDGRAFLLLSFFLSFFLWLARSLCCFFFCLFAACVTTGVLIVFLSSFSVTRTRTIVLMTAELGTWDPASL